MAAPRLPSRLWIGSYEFQLAQKPVDDPLFEGEADGITHFDLPARGVYLRDDLALRSLLEVVLHEITHAIHWAHDLDDAEKFDEEQVATVYGLAWSALLLANPRFQRWLNHTVNAVRKAQANA